MQILLRSVWFSLKMLSQWSSLSGFTCFKFWGFYVSQTKGLHTTLKSARCKCWQNDNPALFAAMTFVPQIQFKTANAAFPFVKKGYKTQRLRPRHGNISEDSSIKLCSSTSKNGSACLTNCGDNLYKKDLSSYNIAGKSAGASVS